MAKTLLAAQTASGNSDIVAVEPGDSATFIIHAASGHTAGEYSDIQITHDEGTTWNDVYINGVQARLHSLNTVQTVYGPGIFRIAKDTTTNATGVSASVKGNL